jgi:hypothetical protein
VKPGRESTISITSSTKYGANSRIGDQEVDHHLGSQCAVAEGFQECQALHVRLVVNRSAPLHVHYEIKYNVPIELRMTLECQNSTRQEQTLSLAQLAAAQEPPFRRERRPRHDHMVGMQELIAHAPPFQNWEMFDEVVAVDHLVYADLPSKGRFLYANARMPEQSLSDDLMAETAAEKLDAWVGAVYH